MTHRRKHQGIGKYGISPPEYLAPRGQGHGFSYMPPNRGQSESGSESDEPEESEKDESLARSSKGKEPLPAPSTDRESSIHERRPSVIRSLEDTDFTIEELSDNDIGHDHLPVIHPDQTEEAESDHASKASERDILDRLKELNCGDREEKERARRFEDAQREAYRKRKKRWSVGGYKKRSHAQSIGSNSSGHEDVELLDDTPSISASARRLRRRTQGPDDSERPNRTSLMFVDPPKELEELAVEDEAPPPLLSDSDGDLWSDDDDDDSDGPEDIEYLLPHWLMDLESNPPSRPSTAASIASAIIDVSHPT